MASDISSMLYVQACGLRTEMVFPSLSFMLVRNTVAKTPAS